MKYNKNDWIIDDNVTEEDLLKGLSEEELEQIRIAKEKYKNDEYK